MLTEVITDESSTQTEWLTREQLRLLDAWWRVANFLSIGQVYLLANPLLREPLNIEHVKPRLFGHSGTTPGLNFLYVHLNRIIQERAPNIRLGACGQCSPGSRYARLQCRSVLGSTLGGAVMSDGLSKLCQEPLSGSYDCVDRIVLNAYFGMGHSPGSFRV